jgi:hypothetical protein
MTDKQLEWKKQGELLKQIVCVEGSCSNYSILRLSNGRRVVLDRSNLKFLLPSSGSLYTLPPNWKKWIKRGFIVIAFPRSLRYSRYYILNAKGRKFIAEGKEVEATADTFLEKQSDYFIAGNKYIGYAIFDKDGNQITDWYNEIGRFGLVSNESNYYIARKDGKEAVFDRDGNQITDWFDWISVNGLVSNQSPYYIANRYGKHAIFYKDGKQISDWYDWILPDGLPDGLSNYYIAARDGKYAIFHKDGRQVSDWFDDVYTDGLVDGQSGYYIVKKDNKKAIFHKDGSRISNWFDHIYSYGLVKGESDYYEAEKDSKYAIFHKDGKQITEWYNWIYFIGLVEGQSDYYVASTGKVYYVSKRGSSKMLGPFKEIVDYGFIKDPSRNEIKVKTSTNQYVTFTKQEAEEFFEEKEIEGE